MIPAPFDYAAPVTLGAAFDLLTTSGGRPLAGGQQLLTDIKTGRTSPPLLVDLGRITSMHGVFGRPDGSTELRAGTTLVEASEHPGVAGRPVLAETIAAVTDPHVRNRATVGGAVRAGARADLAAALLVLDAQVEIVERGGSRRAGAVLFATSTASPPVPGRLVAAVHLPPPRAGSVGAYERVGDRATLAPLCGVAVTLTRAADGTLSSLRAAVTGAVPAARRLSDVEAVLTDAAAPSDDDIEGLAELVGDLPYLDDALASAGYRQHLTGVLLGRALRRALAAA